MDESLHRSIVSHCSGYQLGRFWWHGTVETEQFPALQCSVHSFYSGSFRWPLYYISHHVDLCADWVRIYKVPLTRNRTEQMMRLANNCSWWAVYKVSLASSTFFLLPQLMLKQRFRHCRLVVPSQFDCMTETFAGLFCSSCSKWRTTRRPAPYPSKKSTSANGFCTTKSDYHGKLVDPAFFQIWDSHFLLWLFQFMMIEHFCLLFSFPQCQNMGSGYFNPKCPVLLLLTYPI